VSSALNLAAITGINHLHSHFRISNDNKLYTLRLFVCDHGRWCIRGYGGSQLLKILPLTSYGNSWVKLSESHISYFLQRRLGDKMKSGGNASLTRGLLWMRSYTCVRQEATCGVQEQR
jgi:hypothetical protein